ncbi:hypothetical protein [Peribacillus simplex]|uniref:hypothetical protein n=1 Tax=Peribacillus simplex TaxID=1478 RepID=UPI0021AA6D96|nr:hypothetical protein [Peribacillus simplex]
MNELSNLRVRNLNFEEKQIHVLSKGGKKGVVAVSPPSCRTLKITYLCENGLTIGLRIKE